MIRQLKSIKIIIFLLFTLTCISCSEIIYQHQKNKVIDLSKNWNIKYCINNDCSYFESDKIDLPKSFTSSLLRYTNDFSGFIILSKEFFITKIDSNFYLLSLGKIGDADATYCNGIKIGSCGLVNSKELSQWNTPRYYLIDSKILYTDKSNNIRIEIACYGFNRIIGDIYITPISLNDYTKLTFHANLIQTIPLIINVSLGILFFIIFLLLCHNKIEREKYIYFLLQLIPGLLVILEPTLQYPLYPNTVMRIKIFGIAWNMLVLFHLLFLHRLYNYKRPKVEYYLWFLSSLITILILFFAGSPLQVKIVGIITIVILTSLALYNVSLHISQLIHSNSLAYLFVPIGILLAITAAHDGFVFISIFTFKIYTLFGYSFTSPIFQYTSNAIFIGAGLIIVYQYMLMVKNIENTNIILEEKVNERTQELQNSLNNLSQAIEFGFFAYPVKAPSKFSSQLKSKIKKAIIVINNNYRETLSREGLASLVDLHPDYFSKAFKYFTGKKLNEYINELRVKEAIKLLHETDKTILEIAMKVGFENIRTFNRTFKKITKHNPTDYKKNIIN